jgi:hypothetical protein
VNFPGFTSPPAVDPSNKFSACKISLHSPCQHTFNLL